MSQDIMFPETSPSPPSQPPILRLAVPRSRPIAAWVILLLNILVWLAMTALGGSTDPDVLIAFGAKFNPLIEQGQVWRLITPIFLHIGLMHLLFNSYAIYVIAPQVESFFGAARFVWLYVLSGAYGVWASFVFSPHLSAGASGAIFGLIGAEAAFFYRYRSDFGTRGQRQFYNILSVIAFNLIMTFSVSGIDIWGHIGGLLAGLALGWTMMPRYLPVMSPIGPVMVDDRRAGEWSRVVVIATVLLVGATVAAIWFKRGG